MKLKLGFTGDIAFSEYTKNLIYEKKAINKEILKLLNENDYNILNFESPITKSSITKKNALAHKSDPENLKYIKKTFNNPVLSLANNHMMDFGVKGLLDTLKYVKEESLPYIGIGKNAIEATDYIILGDEVKVGLISFQYKDYMVASKTTPGPAHDKHKKIIKAKIKELKDKVDWVVIVYHGGEEFLNFPMPYTRKKFHNFLKWGADIVVAHHTHTVQGFEKVGNKKMIFYSLGNFIFDTDFQRAQAGTDEGILINLTFSKNTFTHKAIPIMRDRNKNIINKVKKNVNFSDVSKNYNRRWKEEILRVSEIKKIKKRLKFRRRNYSVSNLHMEKIDNLTLMSFDELIKKNYISELDNKPKFNEKNIIVRKFRSKTKKLKKLKKVKKEDIIKRIYIKYAKFTTRKKK